MTPSRAYITPALQPSLADFKSHLRITSNDLDGELQVKLMAAVNAAENMIGQVIALSRFTVKGMLKEYCLVLPSRPLVEVEAVSLDGVPIEDYTLSGRVICFPDEAIGSEVEVTYIAGMQEVPYDIRAAILLHASALFNNPVDSVETLPKASTNLLRPYRLWEIGRKVKK